MEKQDELFEELGVKPFDVLLPAKGVDMSKFAVIACDQHSAEAEYWQLTQRIAGGSPSALNMILPEAFLDKEENAGERDEHCRNVREPADFFVAERQNKRCGEA